MNITQGSKKIIDTCVKVQPYENVVIITDTLRPASLGESLVQAASEAGGQVIKIIFDGTLENGQLIAPAAKAVEYADVLICVTTKTLAYTKAVGLCKARGGRVVAMTEVTEQTFCNGPLEADYPALQQRIDYVKAAFDRAEQVTVTAPGGTDLNLNIKDRAAFTCSGICHQAGQLIGLPAVEVYTAPWETQTNGIFVADASGTGLGILQNPITLLIEKGRVVSIEGKEESNKLKKMLTESQSEASYVIAEFAVGLNPCGELVGNIAADEGLYGTGHFALGNNLGIGGNNDAPVHYDLVYRRPTIKLDGALFMENGVLFQFNEEVVQ